jgi:hypothetical protein
MFFETISGAAMGERRRAEIALSASELAGLKGLAA